MPLDEATRRFAFLLQRELRRLTERDAERDARGEGVKYDSVSRVATVQTAQGEVQQRLYGELLATYAQYDRILRWAWVGRASSSHLTHGDIIVREGQARGVPQLAMSVLGDLDQDDAKRLVTLGALMAHADGVHERRVGNELQYIGLFERPRPVDVTVDSHISVPPPAVQERTDKSSSRPPPRAYRSLPPIREVFEPRSSRSSSQPPPPSEPAARVPASVVPAAPASARPPNAINALRRVREPSRTIFLPVATAALAVLNAKGKGYLQGLFVITVDHVSAADPKRRVVVQLVVVDQAGILRALDPPESLLEAAVEMIEADRRDGNGVWRKLSARITPKPDGGATLNVDVT